MKTVCIVLVAVAYLGATVSACSSNSECDDNECCVLSLFSVFGRDGDCHAKLKEGADCHVGVFDPLFGLREKECGCEAGLRCLQITSGGFFSSGEHRCVRPSTVAPSTGIPSPIPGPSTPPTA
ncbi:uncharacterized protein LOC106170191 [Lingula anatina]|uniref:Uncharacterized protein LOC106170191 n=1 Tax=Lingula anatina TaxID=7574 RepID=A0A1S3J555_LINAN|nr:uncharacterized protein LOC106170191 [Lingula anatina]|eukprot:XP_013405418.2 uncharacterized protein LOC106170191 [Lingula anatina]